MVLLFLFAFLLDEVLLSELRGCSVELRGIALPVSDAVHLRRHSGISRGCMMVVITYTLYTHTHKDDILRKKTFHVYRIYKLALSLSLSKHYINNNYQLCNAPLMISISPFPCKVEQGARSWTEKHVPAKVRADSSRPHKFPTKTRP